MNEVKASNLHLSECNKALFETNEKLSKRNKDLDVVIETNKDNMCKWEKLRVQMEEVIKENKDFSNNNKTLVSINNNLEKCIHLQNDRLNYQDRMLKYLYDIRPLKINTQNKTDINSEVIEDWDDDGILQESRNLLPNAISSNNNTIQPPIKIINDSENLNDGTKNDTQRVNSQYLNNNAQRENAQNNINNIQRENVLNNKTRDRERYRPNQDRSKIINNHNNNKISKNENKNNNINQSYNRRQASYNKYQNDNRQYEIKNYEKNTNYNRNYGINNQNQEDKKADDSNNTRNNQIVKIYIGNVRNGTTFEKMERLIKKVNVETRDLYRLRNNHSYYQSYMVTVLVKDKNRILTQQQWPKSIKVREFIEI